MPGLPAFLQLWEVGHGRAERRHSTDGGYEVHNWAPHSLHSYCFFDSMLGPIFVSTRVSHIRWPQASHVGARVSTISSGAIILSSCRNVEFMLSGLAQHRLLLIHEQPRVKLAFGCGQTPPRLCRPETPHALRCIGRLTGPVQTVLGISVQSAGVHETLTTVQTSRSCVCTPT